MVMGWHRGLLLGDVTIYKFLTDRIFESAFTRSKLWCQGLCLDIPTCGWQEVCYQLLKLWSFEPCHGLHCQEVYTSIVYFGCSSQCPCRVWLDPVILTSWEAHGFFMSTLYAIGYQIYQVLLAKDLWQVWKVRNGLEYYNLLWSR